MNKQEAYKNLVKEYYACNVCEKLHKDIHKLENIAKCKGAMHLNLWNYWQGSLTAKIMVIGQDWGNIDKVCTSEKDCCQSVFNGTYECLEGKHKSVTNAKLIKYLAIALGAAETELYTAREDLYFVNSALCYRESVKISGNDSKRWFDECNAKFMGRLIEIIKPRIIITLGKRPFNGLKNCGTIKPVNGKPIPTIYQDSKSGIEGTISYGRCNFECNGKEYYLFPVCHTGSNAKRNRKEVKVEADWRKIGDFITSLKNNNKW